MFFLTLVLLFIFLILSRKICFPIILSGTVYFLFFLTTIALGSLNEEIFVYGFFWGLFFLVGYFSNIKNRFPLGLNSALKIKSNKYIPLILFSVILLASTYTLIANPAAFTDYNSQLVDEQYDIARSEVGLNYFSYIACRILPYLLSGTGILLLVEYVSLKRVFVGKNVFYLLSGLVNLVLAVLMSLISMQKSPIITLFVAVALSAYFCYENPDKLTFANSLTVLIVIATIFTGASVFAIQHIYHTSLPVTLYSIFNRLFLVVPDIVSNVGKLSLEQPSYLGGASFSSLYSVLGFPNISLGEETYKYMFGRFTKNATANAPCYAGLFIDFGWLSLAFPLAAGILLRTIDSTFLLNLKHRFHQKNFESRNYKHQLIKIVYIASYVTFSLSLIKLNVTVVGTVFLSEGLVPSLLIYVISSKIVVKIFGNNQHLSSKKNESYQGI